MRKVALVGDKTSGCRRTRPGTIVTGSSDVIINGRPAATDGSLVLGKPRRVISTSSVLVNGKPIARMYDRTTGCDLVVTGSSDVLIQGE